VTTSTPPRRPARVHIPPADRPRITARVVDLYTRGLTIAQVAAETSWSETTVRQLLKEARITMRRPGTYDRSRFRRH
jgi:glycine cleavage system regulatory protein